MTSLTGIFGTSNGKPQKESEKLLDLYWSRVELKKDFDGLRDENFQLQDRVKQQEGETANVQKKLDHLEQLLNDPEWVHNVIVHYQLRHLSQCCQSKLENFAEQLKQQREKLQHSQLLTNWNVELADASVGIERSIGEQRKQVQMLEDQLMSERCRRASMSGFFKLFRRRSVTAILDNLAASVEAAKQTENELLLRFDEVQNRVPPDIEGLDIPTKRLINFMILAFAQQLYLHFSADDLAGMAKEAAEKSVGAINYGSKEECDIIVGRVSKRANSLDMATEFADILQQRARLITEKAIFRSDSDAVPVSDSVATVFGISEKGVIKTTEADLLGENYWSLATILSR